jgi:hypothetical protein
VDIALWRRNWLLHEGKLLVAREVEAVLSSARQLMQLPKAGVVELDFVHGHALFVRSQELWLDLGVAAERLAAVDMRVHCATSTRSPGETLWHQTLEHKGASTAFAPALDPATQVEGSLAALPLSRTVGSLPRRAGGRHYYSWTITALQRTNRAAPLQ